MGFRKADESLCTLVDCEREKETEHVNKDSAMEEESDNELQESTIKKELLSSARDGIGAVLNYVDSSTNQKLQQYYEHKNCEGDPN
jgi:hypothetical protein